MVLEYLRDTLGNGVWPKGITYNITACIDECSVEKYYILIVQQKTILINIVLKEVEMVISLIEAYARMYVKILDSAEKIDIHTLDQACDNIDRTVGHTRKIIIKIPTIVDTKIKIDLKNKHEKDLLLRERLKKKKYEREKQLQGLHKKYMREKKKLKKMSLI